jgi:hypothetical protein
MGRPENYTKHPDYDELPESIKCAFTPKEYAWMDDEQKRTLQQDMTNPEVEE